MTIRGSCLEAVSGALWIEARRLYAQRHSFLSHALAMGNSPADLAAAAGHSIKMLLDTYAKPTVRLKMPSWQTA